VGSTAYGVAGNRLPLSLESLRTFLSAGLSSLERGDGVVGGSIDYIAPRRSLYLDA